MMRLGLALRLGGTLLGLEGVPLMVEVAVEEEDLRRPGSESLADKVGRGIFLERGSLYRLEHVPCRMRASRDGKTGRKATGRGCLAKSGFGCGRPTNA